MNPKVQEKWANYILDLFECNFTKSRPYLPFTRKSRQLNNFKICDETASSKRSGCRKWNWAEAAELCLQKKRVIKTIKPADIDVLLSIANERSVDLRVLIYYR